MIMTAVEMVTTLNDGGYDGDDCDDDGNGNPPLVTCVSKSNEVNDSFGDLPPARELD